MADVTTVARKALEKAEGVNPAKPNSPLAGGKGVAAGVALAALPLAAKGVAKLVGPKVSDLGEKASELGDQATGKARQAVKQAADEVTPDMPKGLFGGLFGGDGKSDGKDESGGSGAAPGHGSGRRMPIQQTVDVGRPLDFVYDQWTRFEDWPRFMHRVDSAEQIDDATAAFSVKVWGITKRFEAKILDQHPSKRIRWDVSQGLAHTGAVTFHDLGDELTRINVTVDVEPDSLLEKAGRGMRFAKRAVRGDLHRFKAHVELLEDEEADDGWRGTIEDGKVKRRTERRQSRSGGGRRRSANGSRSSARSRGSASGSSRRSSGSSRQTSRSR